VRFISQQWLSTLSLLYLKTTGLKNESLMRSPKKEMIGTSFFTVRICSAKNLKPVRHPFQTTIKRPERSLLNKRRGSHPEYGQGCNRYAQLKEQGLIMGYNPNAFRPLSI
jgi:hypothetical protein